VVRFMAAAIWFVSFLILWFTASALMVGLLVKRKHC